MAQRQRAGLITLRSLDQNKLSVFFTLTVLKKLVQTLSHPHGGQQTPSNYNLTPHRGSDMFDGYLSHLKAGVGSIPTGGIRVGLRDVKQSGDGLVDNGARRVIACMYSMTKSRYQVQDGWMRERGIRHINYN